MAASGRQSGVERLGRLLAEAGRWLNRHPSKRAPLNWALWGLVVIVLIGTIAGAGSGSTKSVSSPASASTAPLTTATRPRPTTTTRRAPTTKPNTGLHAPPRPGSTGGVVTIGSGAVLPNPARTPGAANPQVTQSDIYSTICVSGWTSTVRPPSSYTTDLKEQQLASGYAYRGDMNPSDYEEDHLIPLELGGAPASTLNLWPEPYNTADGARVKDEVENKLNSLVCDGSMALTAAQHMIATNWFAAFVTYVGTPSPAPSSTTGPPPRTTPTTSPHSSLGCAASVSNSSPPDYSTVDVTVRTGAPGATVTATAHYKSTDTTHTATADGTGTAIIAFHISRATPGYTVTVDVTVTAGGASASCSTSFTPH